jgi:hypothetical protein
MIGVDRKEEKGHMFSVRTVMMTALTVMAFGAGWLPKTSAQTKAPAPLIAYYSHEKVDASFAEALATTGSKDLFTRKDRQGRTWGARSNSRGKADEGKLHSHEDWTAVVVIMSGAATFITPGTAAPWGLSCNARGRAVDWRR